MAEGSATLPRGSALVRSLPAEGIGLALGLTLYAVSIFRHRHFFHDDAFITLRYARNLADLGAIAWNPGEMVEGYTSLLHVVLLGGLIRVGADPVVAAMALGFAAMVLLMFYAWRATGLIAPAPAHAPLRALALAIMAATPALAVWTLGGLEAMPGAALMAGGLFHALRLAVRGLSRRDALAAGVFFALAILTRLDNAVAVAAIGGAILFGTAGPLRHRLAAAVAVAVLPAVVALVQMAVRLGVYGLPFPLTFYAKTDTPFALRLQIAGDYFVSSVAWMPAAFLGLGLGILLLLRHPAATVRVLVAACLVQALFVLWAGGDHMEAARMLLVMVVPGSLILLAVAQHRAGAARRAPLALALVATVAAALLQPATPKDMAAFVGRIIGEHIGSTWPAGSLVALHTAGSTPYYATGMRYIDMLGLNDPVIALRRGIDIRTPFQYLPGHAKGDGTYVLARRPDFIIAGFAHGMRAEDGPFLTDLELSQSPEFRRCYRLETTRVAFDAGRDESRPEVLNPLRFTYYRRICD